MLFHEIAAFINASQGLSLSVSEGLIAIDQKIDSKRLTFWISDLKEVIQRFDSERKPFIQVNFNSGVRLLFTDTLIGFKPDESIGLDYNRLPKVVTTPDLQIVLTAIEETMGCEGTSDHELEILKKVYVSILSGAERSGFNINNEKEIANRLRVSNIRASA